MQTKRRAVENLLQRMVKREGPTKPWKECLDSALASHKHPFFISDMGDNPTAGGAGDVTWTLTQILSARMVKSSD